MHELRSATAVAVVLAGVLSTGLVTAATWTPAGTEQLAQRDARPSPPAREALREPVRAPVAAAEAPAPAPVAQVPTTRAPASAPPPGPAASSSAAARPAAPPAPPAPAPAPLAPPPAPAPPPAAPPAAPVGTSDREYENRLVAGVNAERTSRGLPALTRDGCADRPAREQAARMAAAGSLSHQDLNGVLDACGGTRAAENVGAGDVSPERLVELWMASASHRRNVLDPALTSLGSGAVRRADGRWYASHVFLGR